MGNPIDYIIREWNTVTAAPLTVLVLFLIGQLFGWSAWKWYYLKQIGDRDTRIELLEHRIQASQIDIQAMQLNAAFDADYYRLLENWARKKAHEKDGQS